MRSDVGRCHRCGSEKGQYVHGPLAHPGTYWCERCLVEVELESARKAVSKIAKLEQRLKKLGGPAERVLCGYVNAKFENDPAPFGAYCWKKRGHGGFHNVRLPAAALSRRLSEETTP